MVDTRSALFEDLPEQERGEPRPRPLPRLRQAERDQAELRCVSLEDLVAADHRVRLVWAFCETLDLAPLYAAIRAVEGHPGHPPADPRILMALWLYATVDGVGSARALARLCEQHLAYQWLCGGVGMNHKTLADFRVAHGALLERLLVDSFAALLRAGIAGLERVAQDGMRVRASAGASSFRRGSTLRACRREAQARVDRLRGELDADPAAQSRREAAQRARAATDRLRRVETALAAAEALAAAQKPRKGEARKGEAGKGETGKGEAGKGEAGTGGTKAGAVTEPECESESDAAPVAAAEAEPRPQGPEPRVSTTDVEARVMKMGDGGFRPAYNVQFCADTASGAVAGVAVDAVGSDMGKMAPMSDALAAAYGRRPPQHLADGGFAKLADIERLAGLGVMVYAPVPTPRDPTRERHAPRASDTAAVAGWRARMGGDDAKAIYRARAAAVECVNAQARNRGLTRFLVRGLDKVRAVACWHALAHNMACTWRLAPTPA